MLKRFKHDSFYKTEVLIFCVSLTVLILYYVNFLSMAVSINNYVDILCKHNSFDNLLISLGMAVSIKNYNDISFFNIF